MEKIYFTHKAGRFQFKAIEWRCCGLIWQLLLSKNYPDRYNWNPTCPKCGEIFDTHISDGGG